MKIRVEKIVYPGKSLGRGEDGIAVFTEGVLAGETAEIAVTKNKKTFREGKLVRIEESSALRREPSCPSFGKCGGCSFQHTEYDNQLRIKEAYVGELLSGFGAAIAPVIPSPLLWGYRNKMEFSFFEKEGLVAAGLHEKNEFDRYFPVPPCLICDKDFLEVTEIITRFAVESKLPRYNKRSHQGFYRHLVLRKGVRTGELLVNLVTNRGEVTRAFFEPLIERLRGKVTSFYWTVNAGLSDAVNADELILLSGKESIEEHLSVKGRTYVFAVSPFSFFQTNTLGTEKLYETVVECLEGTPSSGVLDLYCGTGTIGITLAPYVRAVHGVEQVPSAIENAQANSRRNGMNNISFSVGSVEKWIRKEASPVFDAIIVDPPRGGLSNKVVDFIINKRPRKAVYVSCNPATLARDLRELVGRGEYVVERIVPVDMFPQTYHVEVVVSLVKKETVLDK